MTNRMLILMAIAGMILLGFGVLFLLAAFSSAKYFLLALVFLGLGGFSFGGAAVMKKNLSELSPEEANEQWLPIDELFQYSWARLLAVIAIAFVALMLYWIAAGTNAPIFWLGLLVVAAIAIVAVNFTAIKRFASEQAAVMDILPKFRVIVRKAFLTRARIYKIYGGVRKSRREWWARFAEEGDQIVVVVLNTARRASDVEGSSLKTLQKLAAALETAKSNLDALAEKLAEAATATDLNSFERELDGMKDVLGTLDDRQAAQREMRG